MYHCIANVQITSGAAEEKPPSIQPQSPPVETPSIEPEALTSPVPPPVKPKPPKVKPKPSVETKAVYPQPSLVQPKPPPVKPKPSSFKAQALQGVDNHSSVAEDIDGMLTKLFSTEH